MTDYPNLKRAVIWLASQAIPAIIIFGIGFSVGSDFGEKRGRLEIQCAYQALFERITQEPQPGMVTLGCDKIKIVVR